MGCSRSVHMFPALIYMENFQNFRQATNSKMFAPMFWTIVRPRFKHFGNCGTFGFPTCWSLEGLGTLEVSRLTEIWERDLEF